MEENKELLTTYRILHEAVQVAHAHGVRHVVLCPGSRSAPLALSFLRFEGIQHFIIPDERSAAYTALGISKAAQSPVALVCTSGTAALNFAPAVAEAFFSEVPLIVFTADRPQEWLGQADNQAIYQDKVYSHHVKAQYTLPADLYHADAQWFAIRQVNEALRTALEGPQGPVHINVPLREPLYLQEVPDFSGIKPRVIQKASANRVVDADLLIELTRFERILCVGGMSLPDPALRQEVSKALRNSSLVFIPDITSNLHDIQGAIPFAELAMESASPEKLEPDLILSFGGPIVSKGIKQFLRTSKAEHWHIGPSINPADTFQKLTKVVPVYPAEFFAQWNSINRLGESNYQSLWQGKQEQVHRRIIEVMPELPYTEIKAMATVLDALPSGSVLHLGNSLPIRYASVFPILPQGIEIFSNRGTSGIDGCVSTSAGHSLVDGRIHTLIVGDLSFLYDSNGLWNNYLRPNLKIIVLNNHGGGIFRTLPGSAKQPELEEYFVVKQPLRMEYTTLQHGCEYFYCDNEEHLEATLMSFYGINDKPAVLELDFNEQLSIGEVKRKINGR